MNETKVKPFVPCVDYWPRQIPLEKLQIYKQFLKDGQITKPAVVYNRTTGSTTVQYEAIAPHEWILDQMKQIAN